MTDPQDNTPPPAGEDDHRWRRPDPEYAPPTQQMPPVTGGLGDTQQAYADHPVDPRQAYSEYPQQTVQGYPPPQGYAPYAGHAAYDTPPPYGHQPPYGSQQPYGDQSQQWDQQQEPGTGGLRAGTIVASAAGLFVVAAAVVLILGFVWPKIFVTSVLDTHAAETSIAGVLSSDFQIDSVGQVSCPERIEVESGSSFVCNAVIDGKATSVTSTFTDDDGSYVVAQPTAS